MSTLRTTNLKHASSASNNIVLDSSGHASITNDLKFNSGYGSAATAYGVRAWVNFDGTGTVSIRDSGNVSSITDHTTGDYSVNLTNNLSDANYCVTAVPSLESAESDTREISINLNRTYSSSTFGLKTAYNGSSAQDRSMVCAIVVR